jgi:D-tyrosyl-tRNA(Tyr) deacylase
LLFVALAPGEMQWPDAREFEAVGRSLLESGTYGPHTLRPPGYPTLIAAVYLVFGPGLLALRLVEALLGVLSVALIGVVGARVFGRRAGLIAAALAALHPVLAFLPTIQYSENTLVLVVVLAFGATFEAWRGGGLLRWAASGALWGLALLVRPNTLLVLPGLAIGLALALHRERRAWRIPALVSIAAGLLVLLGIAKTDTERDADHLAEKLLVLRIFPDEAGKMNRSVIEAGGSVLVVSNFTLYGDCSKGRRPAFDLAAPPEQARPLYDYFVGKLRGRAVPVETGIFQAAMSVHLVNEGPVTLICESRSQ